MKVSGTGAPAPVSGGVNRRGGEGGFAPAQASAGGEASAAERAAGVATVASLEALLALQETTGPLERRRRAIRRADRMLDGLDGLRLALLEGANGTAALNALLGSRREARDRTDDAGLESLLDHVDLRAAVELAKAEPRRAA